MANVHGAQPAAYFNSGIRATTRVVSLNYRLAGDRRGDGPTGAGDSSPVGIDAIDHIGTLNRYDPNEPTGIGAGVERRTTAPRPDPNNTPQPKP